MSNTLKIQTTKKGFKIAKVKTIANEHYIIVDESGKVFNKLKFVQVEKNLEVFTDVEGKEEKIAVLENYYDSNMNASIVGLDSGNKEVGYILNQSDGWYYLGGELPETELGVVAFPFLGMATIGAAGAGAIVATNDNNGETTPTDPSVDALNKIRDAAQNNNADATLSVDIYTTAGITGVTSKNISSINSSLNTLLIDGVKADTKVEVQKIVDSYNKILDEANGTTADATPNNDPTADDYTSIGADISSVISNDKSLTLLNDIIKTKNKEDVDTVPEVENIAKSVKDIIDVAGGNKNSITPNTIINDLDKFGITANGNSIQNLSSIQQQKILDAIKATDDSGSQVNTKQKLQDIVNNAIKPDSPSITSDQYTIASTPLITGTAEAGSTLTVEVGSATYLTVATADGKWSIDTTTATPVKGESTVIAQTGTNIVVTATNATNSTSSPSTQILKFIPTPSILGYIDDVGSVQSANSTESVTDDTIPIFNIGSLPIGADVSLYVDETFKTSTYDRTTGMLIPSLPLTEGTHNIKYVYHIGFGTTVTSNIFTLTIDTTPPSEIPADITSYVDNVGLIQNLTSIASTTDDTTPGFNIGTLPSGVAKAILYVDSIAVDATYVNGVLTPVNPLVEGLHSITYAYADAAGNIGTKSNAFSLTIDTTPATGDISVDKINQYKLELINNKDASEHDPQIVSFSDGSYVVIYETWTYNNMNVYLERFDASGKKIGTQDFGYDWAYGPSIKTLADDTYIVALTKEKGGIYTACVQRFNKDGSPVSPSHELAVDIILERSDWPFVATFNDGSYIVSYTGKTYQSDGTSTIGVTYFQKFDKYDNPIGTPSKIVLNDNVDINQKAHNSKIITFADGSFVVEFISTNVSNINEYFVYLQKFDSNGNATSGQIRLEDTSGKGISGWDYAESDTVMLKNGNFVATYITDSGTYIQKFDSNCVAIGPKTYIGQTTIAINNTTYVGDHTPNIVALDNGGFIVTYSITTTENPNSYEGYVQRFDANGQAQAAVKLDGYTNKHDPKIVLFNDGSYLVTYYGYLSNNTSSIYIQKFDSFGHVVGSLSKLDGVGVGSSNGTPEIAILPDGSYVVTYTGVDGEGDESVFVQKFNSDATNGQEAIDAYIKYKPDLVTMDITMPDMDGITAVKHIMKDDKDAKVIMVTSHGQEDMVIKSIQAGAVGYILKPITDEKLAQVIGEVFVEYATEIDEDELDLTELDL